MQDELWSYVNEQNLGPADAHRTSNRREREMLLSQKGRQPSVQGRRYIFKLVDTRMQLQLVIIAGANCNNIISSAKLQDCERQIGTCS